MGIDYTALAFPKGPPARDKKYLSFVREQICAVVGNGCGGVTEAAHIGVAGRGLKASDFLTIPLCSHHHRASHQLGILTFQRNFEVNIWEVAAKLLAKFLERT